MKQVAVTLDSVGAWEVWVCEVPDDADEQWIKDNFSAAEKFLDESGADSYEITAIENIH